MTWETWSTFAAFGIVIAAFLLEKLGDWMTVNGYGAKEGKR